MARRTPFSTWRYRPRQHSCQTTTCWKTIRGISTRQNAKLEPSGSALSHALRWLECDTKLVSSHLTKGYAWFVQLYFPFPVYIRITQALKACPLGSGAERAWGVFEEASKESPVTPPRVVKRLEDCAACHGIVST